VCAEKASISPQRIRLSADATFEGHLFLNKQAYFHAKRIVPFIDDPDTLQKKRPGAE
jgi:hypothetical protein